MKNDEKCMYCLPYESEDPAIRCVACGKVATAIGNLMKRNASNSLMNPGVLFECHECGLLFRSPFLSEKELEAEYKKLSDNIWENIEKRPDFEMAIQKLSESYFSGNVLDVGCYCGDLLAMLPDSFHKFGIEPSAMACEKAKSRGICIVGASVFDMGTDLPMFDCIFMLDVIEHITNPVKVLERLTAKLKPNGLLIISTGNTDSFFWRIARLDYYYYFYEHLTFYNPKWFRWVTTKISMDIISIKRFSRAQSNLIQKAKVIVLFFAYRLTSYASRIPIITELIDNIYPLNKISKLTISPCGAQWSDHLLIVLKKK